MRAKTALTGLLLSLALTAAASAQSASREILIRPFGRFPSAVATADGNFVVTWQEPASSGEDVFVQLFNDRGRPTSPVQVVSNAFGQQLYPRVAADDRGNFAVVWQGGTNVSSQPGFPGGDGQGTGIFLQRFDRSGRRVGPARIVNRPTDGIQIDPDVAMNREGSFMVAWHDQEGLRAQVFAPSGRRRGGTVEVESVDRNGVSPFVTADPEGFAVGWTEQRFCPSFGFESIPRIVRFTGSGQPLGPSFQLDDGTCDVTGWRLRGLASGDSGSVALFEGFARNSVQLFEPSGEPAGPRKIVGERQRCVGAVCETVRSVAMESSGRFAVVWALALDVPSSSEGDRNPPRYKLLARFFDPQGQPLSEAFPVTEALARFEPTVAAALSDEGSLIVVWNRNAAEPEKSGMFLRRFTID